MNAANAEFEEQAVTETKVDKEVDLSRQIEKQIPHGRGEVPKVTHVYGNRYRCNFWVFDVDQVAGRIARSAFLKVSQTKDGFVIE